MKNSCVSSMHTCHSGSRRRSSAGFTLVELLVVITIIGLLAAIVTPAVMRSMSTARAAAVKTEIDLLHTALMNYKQEYGSFPPADMRGLWNGSAVNTAHPAYKHLKRAFPRLNEQETSAGGAISPYYFMAQMSPAQALVFWLQGFFENPQYPLTNGLPLSATDPRAGDSQGSRKRMFDFDEKRLYAADAYFQATKPTAYSDPQTFKSRNAASGFSREYPVYFPNMPNAGLPYVYFPSSTYSGNPQGSVTETISSYGGTPPIFYYHAVSLKGDTSYVTPCFTSSSPSQPTLAPWAQWHVNPDTFQLIAAGADGTYGTTAAAFPDILQAFTYTAGGGSINVNQLKSVKDSAGAEDNITNFANGRLKDAAQQLLNQ